MEEDKIYVAVGKEVRESISVLSWALRNCRGKRVCIIHVHQLDKHIPTPIGYLVAERVSEAHLKAHRELERHKMSAILDEYVDICMQVGVNAEKLHMEEDYIEKGIIKLIQQHKIKKLVMGAAADKHYDSKRKRDLRSKKAIYVREYAPPFCHVWFVCKGLLIHTRRAILAPIENEIVIAGAKRNGLQAPTAAEALPARWSIDVVKDAGAGGGSKHIPERSKSLNIRLGLERDPIEGTSEDQLSSVLAVHVRDSHLASQNELSHGNFLQNMYIEERTRRKEVEAELERVKQELDRMKNNMIVELPKVKEELDYMKNQVAELANVKAVLDYMKNNVLGELQSAAEQKALLENQIGNSTYLLQVLGDKLSSAINLVHNHGEQYTHM